MLARANMDAFGTQQVAVILISLTGINLQLAFATSPARGQVHSNASIMSVHVLPFMHGDEPHSSGLISQL